MDVKTEKLIIQHKAAGKSSREIEKITGVSKSTVNRLALKKKDIIKAQTERLIEALPDIIGDIVRDVKTSTKLSEMFAGEREIEDMPLLLGAETAILTKFMDLSYKMKSDVLKALGVLPSHAPSIFIQNLFQSGEGSVISQKILNLVGDKLRDNVVDDGEEDGEIIEIEKEEDDADI